MSRTLSEASQSNVAARVRALALALGLVVSGGSIAACGPMVSTTKIEQGDAVTTGDPKYDEFFQSVLDQKSKVEGLDASQGLRKTLSDGLGMKEAKSNDDLFAAAKSKADGMKASGGLYVQMLPRAKLYKRGTIPKDAEGFSKSVEKTVDDGIARSDELDGIALKCEALTTEADGLIDRVGETFKDGKKKDDVVAELKGAKEVLEHTRLKALAESGRALSFVLELARNVSTGGADAVAVADATPAPSAKPAVPHGGGGRPVGKKTGFDP